MTLINKIKNNQKIFKKIISVLLVVIWCIVIFNFSNENGVESTEKSDKVKNVIFVILEYFKFTEESINTLQSYMTLIVRKSAHILSYLILAVLTSNMFKNILGKKMQKNSFKKLDKTIIYSFMFCLIYASFDELHQTFVPRKKRTN